VKPAPFEYRVARGVEDALRVLAAAGGDAKILAGGQSLLPMMNFRLVTPTVLLDINRIAGLEAMTAHADRLTLGALVRHRVTATDPAVAARFPVLAHAMTHVAHHTIRNRGTFVGSLCHADPAAEIPMLAVLLNAGIDIASARGRRRLEARDFFLGPLSTSLEADEMVIGVDLPNLPPGTGWGFAEFARRRGDFALAAACACLRRQDGRARDVRIAVTGVGGTPLRMTDAERVLEETGMAALPDAIAVIRGAVEPNTDPHASADYRRHLVGVLAARALTAAWNRAAESSR
jgi:CO/xanthine dehydrogenase FAD-binding subunit